VVPRSLSLSKVQVSVLLASGGWLPILGSLCLLGSALLHFLFSPHFQERRDASLQQIAIQQAVSRAPPVPTALAPRYEEFRSQLVASEAWGERLKSLFAVAAEAGVTLAQADYRRQVDTNCGCQSLHLTLPVRGTYPQVRVFIDAALAHFPYLALDEISLRRESVQHPMVDARLQLTLYLRTGD
jgi:hypothetical protein